MSEDNAKPANEPAKDEGPKPGSDEYNQQMADNFRNQDQSTEAANQPELAAQQSVPPKPENGHDKFYNAETGAYNWEAHAKELEFNASGRGKETSPSDNPPSDADAAKMIADAGLELDDVVKSLKETGDLSGEQRAALKDKVGLTDEFIDGYLDGQKALVAMSEQKVKAQHEYVGGEAEWQKISAWAAENLNNAQADYINTELASDDWKGGMDQLRSWYQAGAKAAPGQHISADGPGGGEVGYDSRKAMIKDMQSPEYHTDAAFREKVRRRVAVSDFKGDAAL